MSAPQIDLVTRTRIAASKSLLAFMETIWKTPNGQTVRASKIHEVEWGFLDRAWEAGFPVLILAPFGTGKTETLLGWCLRQLARNPMSRGGLISDKDEHGQDRLAVIKRYIQQDPDFRRL